MPIQFSIDAPRGMVFSTASGVLSRSDALAHMDQLSSHADFQPHFRQLFDFTGVTAMGISGEDVRTFANRNVFSTKTRRAFVVGSDLQFGLSRMFATYRELAGESTIQIFKDRTEALSWLGLKDEAS